MARDADRAAHPAGGSPPPALVVTLVLLLTAAHVLLAVSSLRTKSATYDEPGHLRYGQQVLEGDFRVVHERVGQKVAGSPASAANALLAGRAAEPDDLPSLHRARLATVAFSALAALAVFALGRELFGSAGGLLALLLYAAAPGVLAHARLVTTDLWVAGTVLLACAAAWSAGVRGGVWRVALSGGSAGLALMAKFSAVLLLPTLAVAWAVTARARCGGTGRTTAGHLLARLLLWIAALLLVLNAGYFFTGVFVPLDQLDFRTPVLSTVAEHAPWLRLPLPAEWIKGLDWVVWLERSGAGRGPTYLFGTLHEGNVPGYYLVAAAVKLPLGFLMLVLWAAVRLIRRRRSAPTGLAFVVVPALAWLLYFNFASPAQIGMRLVLPATVLLIVTVGALLAPELGVRRRWQRLAVWGAAGAAVLSSLTYHPHYLSYFNAFVTDRTTAYRLLADSNLDWGQNELYLARFLREHPEAAVNPRRPLSGLVVASANVVTGVVPLPGTEWLQRLAREQDPVGHVAYSYLVFDVSPATARRLTAEVPVGELPNAAHVEAGVSLRDPGAPPGRP